MSAPTERRSALLTRVGERHLALPLNVVREVLPLAELTPVQGGVPGLRGSLDLHGSLVPALDLRRLLAVPEVDRSDTPMLVVEHEGGGVLLVLDEVVGVIEVEVATVRPRRAHEPVPPFVIGTVALFQGLTWLIDPELLLRYLEGGAP